MRVAMIVDDERLLQEHAMLNRLSIGLIGEGLKLTRILPEAMPSAAVDEGEQRVALAGKVTVPMRVLPWMRRDRIRRAAEAMGRDVPDVFSVHGERAWRVGLDLSQAMNRPMVVDIWAARQIRRVPRGRGAPTVAGYLVPTQAMADALRRRVDPGLVCLAPMGVALPAEPRRILADPENAIALAIIGRARDLTAYRALLTGIARLVREMPQLFIFLELSGPGEHEIWRHARDLDLLPHLSAVTEGSRHRSLLTRCDVVVMPERNGELRSLILEAMAYAIPVAAATDPFLDMLVRGETAVLVDQPNAEEWTERLRELLTDRDLARALGAAARERVAADHRSSDQVVRLLRALERVAGGGSLPVSYTHLTLPTN